MCDSDSTENVRHLCSQRLIRKSITRACGSALGSQVLADNGSLLGTSAAADRQACKPESIRGLAACGSNSPLRPHPPKGSGSKSTHPLGQKREQFNSPSAEAHGSRASTAHRSFSGCQRESDCRDAVARLCEGIAAVHTRDSANDCQSQSVTIRRTRSRGVAAPESLKHSPWLRNRWTNVADRDPGYAIETLHLNGNGRTRRRVARRV